MFWIFVGFGLLASAISVNKVILQSVPLIFFVGLRMFLAGVILCGLFYKKSPRLTLTNIRRDAGILIWIALCTTFFPSLLKAFGLKYLVSSKAAFIGALDPFVTAIYSYALWAERLSPRKIIGIALGFIGTILLCIPQDTIEKTMISFLIFSLPELAAFGAVAIGRYGWISAQRVLRQDRYSPPELNGLIMTISGVIGLTTSCLVDQFDLTYFPTTITFLSLLAYTVIIGNVVAYTMYAHFLKAYSANFVSLAGFSVPIFVSIYGLLFLGEKITPMLVISSSIIFVGVFIFYQDEIKKRVI